MNIRTLILPALAVMAIGVGGAAPALADYPGPHPFYLHALGDLRYAHVLLDHGSYRPGVNGQEDAALDEIQRAYQDIRQAGIDDGKDIDDHFVDQGIDRRGRLERALQALREARRDVARPESDPVALAARDRAVRAIDGAINHTQHAIYDAAAAPGIEDAALIDQNGVPSYAEWQPAWDQNRFDARHVILGTVAKFDPYRLQVARRDGQIQMIDLKNGTVILPTGTTPMLNERVAIVGYYSNGTFIANRLIIHP